MEIETGELEINNKYIEKIMNLCKQLNSHINTLVDLNNRICCSINSIEATDGITISGVCGRGYTYAEACNDYWNELNNLDDGKWLVYSNGYKDKIRIYLKEED